MKKFGELKSKLLSKLVEAYSTQNKEQTKYILNFLSENKDFKEMYLFYEEMENLELSHDNSAELYVESVEPLLIEKTESIQNFCKKLNAVVGKIDYEKNELYECLDILAEKSHIFNIDKKISARKKLIEHLKKEKKKDIVENNSTYTQNETLLMALLSNDFNSYYGKVMTNEEKEKLKTILETKDIEAKIQELSEAINQKINKILVENTDINISSKLNKVKEEVSNIKPTKYNYYKLMELKNGLD